MDFPFFQHLFYVFVNMGPYWSKNFKTLLLPQIVLNLFELFLNFLLSGPNKSTILDFLKFRFTIFHDFCFVFINMRQYGSKIFKNFKMLLLPQITFETFFSEFSSQWSSQKYCLGFLEV